MRVKKDYIGNEQLIPAYNMQVAVYDEYVAAVTTEQFASDMGMGCFVPLMVKLLQKTFPIFCSRRRMWFLKQLFLLLGTWSRKVYETINEQNCRNAQNQAT